MNHLTINQTELLECYVSDINNLENTFLCIRSGNEVTIIKNNLFIIVNNNNDIVALYGLNNNGIREYFTFNNIQSIKFCKQTKNGIEDIIEDDKKNNIEEEMSNICNNVLC